MSPPDAFPIGARFSALLYDTDHVGSPAVAVEVVIEPGRLRIEAGDRRWHLDWPGRPRVVESTDEVYRNEHGLWVVRERRA